jgi:hypothetical protein
VPAVAIFSKSTYRPWTLPLKYRIKVIQHSQIKPSTLPNVNILWPSRMFFQLHRSSFDFARCQREIPETGLAGIAFFVVGQTALSLPGLTTGCIPPIFIPDVVLLYKKR